MPSRGWLCALAFGLLLAPSSAGAWTSITSGGNPIWWASGNPETSWHLSSNYTCDDLPNASVDSALAAAINEWAVPGCTSFNASQGADRSGNPLDGNQNEDLVGFTSSWPSAWGATTLAVTMPVFFGDGEIARASMVINELNYGWVNGNPSWDEADLQSVAAHEFGHWIGFDHSNYSGSTLTAYYSGNTAERTLTCDDTEGVCWLYSGGGDGCSDDRYCECGIPCNNGQCGGVPVDDDDATAPTDDDDVVSGPCAGALEAFSESEPNDWQTDGEVDYFTPGGGDLTLSGSITCGNNGDGYTADADWFVLDFPCESDARFGLDWSGADSDLDFYVYAQTGDELTSGTGPEYYGPEVAESPAGGRIFFLIACWVGSAASYDFTIDWAPFGSSGDDDDDATAPPDDDDASDDDDTSDGGSGGGGGGRGGGGCACNVPAPARGLPALLAGLVVLGLGGLRRHRP